MNDVRKMGCVLTMVVAMLAMQTFATDGCCDCDECCPCCQPGCGTPGYWMNHPDAWPGDTITVGFATYSQDDAIAMMKAPVQGDKTLTLFPALVAAKLNVLIGNYVCDAMEDVIDTADEWLGFNPPGSGVKASSLAWYEGGALCNWLDAYNNGLLCAPSRD